jgi:Rrf2 family transcriptional regulator, nitric oxide-sensitive transcriptional repressor
MALTLSHFIFILTRTSTIELHIWEIIMHLTRYTDYEFRTLMYIGINNNRNCTISEIAERYSISRNHLMKIVHQLGKEGMLKTIRGRDGGLRLGRDPGEVTVGEIVRVTEENFTLVECFDAAKNQCQITSACVLSSTVRDALAAFIEVLDSITLAEIIEPERGELVKLIGMEIA